jgi:hypothetical protein
MGMFSAPSVTRAWHAVSSNPGKAVAVLTAVSAAKIYKLNVNNTKKTLPMIKRVLPRVPLTRQAI